MDLLLDTHALLWFYGGDDLLPKDIGQQIRNPDNRCLVSVASLWEITIKISLGKLIIGTPISTLFEFLERNQLWVLPIGLPHILRLETLPYHHKDPFDRIIIAQALAEQVPIVTKDLIFSDYGINRQW